MTTLLLSAATITALLYAWRLHRRIRLMRSVSRMQASALLVTHAMHRPLFAALRKSDNRMEAN